MKTNVFASFVLVCSMLTSLAAGNSNMGNLKLDYSISNGIGNFIVHGTKNYTYQIEESFDLNSWHSLGNMLTATSTSTTVSLPLGTNSCGFYRFQEFSSSNKLTISLDPSSPPYQVVSAGTEGVVAGVYKFTALYEDVLLKRIELKLTEASQYDSASATIWDGSRLVGVSGVIFGTNTNFVPMSVPVQKNTSKSLTIKTDILSETPSGTLIKIDVVSCNTSGITSYELANTSSTTSVEGIRVFKSFPIITSGVAQYSQLTDGFQTLFEADISASPSGDVGLQKLSFYVDTIDCSVYNLAFVDQDNQRCGVTDTSVESWVTVTFNTPLIIPAGTTKTFQLTGVVVGSSQESVVITCFIGDYQYDGMKVEQNYLIWSPDPNSMDPDWTDGYGIVPYFPGLYRVLLQ